MKDLTKHFRTLNRHEGLRGAFKDLFSRDYKITNKSKIRTIIKELNRANNTTVILTTHDISDIMVYAGSHLAIDWSVFTVLLLIVNWIPASLINIGLIVIIMSTAFWIINAMSLLETVFTIRDYARYPMDIFSRAFRVFFAFILPISYLSFYPCTILLRPPAEVPLAAWFTPLVGGLLFLISYRIWRKGVNKYEGTGS